MHNVLRDLQESPLGARANQLEAMTIEMAARPDENYQKAMAKQIDAWRATVARYESDPKEGDGRRELMALVTAVLERRG